MPDARPEVLFVCVHNAGRSQMAAALLAHHAGDRVVVRSAGSAPADDVNPAVVDVMAELGIDLRAAGAHPKKLDEAAVRASDVVITMGCGDTCPIFPGKRYEDWDLADPAGQGADAVRPIRDEISDGSSSSSPPSGWRSSTADRSGRPEHGARSATVHPEADRRSGAPVIIRGRRRRRATRPATRSRRCVPPSDPASRAGCPGPSPRPPPCWSR